MRAAAGSGGCEIQRVRSGVVHALEGEFLELAQRSQPDGAMGVDGVFVVDGEPAVGTLGEIDDAQRVTRALEQRLQCALRRLRIATSRNFRSGSGASANAKPSLSSGQLSRSSEVSRGQRAGSAARNSAESSGFAGPSSCALREEVTELESAERRRDGQQKDLLQKAPPAEASGRLKAKGS